MPAATVRILIVDDDEEWVEVCETALRLEGHDTESVLTGAAAIKRIQDERFDLVLTDLKMPDPHDGRAVTLAVKKRWPETDVILMTGSPSLQSAVDVLKEGAYDYIIKPFTPDYLRAVVARCVEKRRTAADLAESQRLREELSSAYEELKRVEKLKDAFLSRVSHEFNTPLTYTALGVSLLREKLKDRPEYAKDIARAQQGIEKLQAVIDDLLSFMDLQKPDLELKKEPVDLDALFREVVEETRRLWEARGLRAYAAVQPGMAPVQADRALLKRALRQLTLNAINFSKNDGGVVELTAEDTPQWVQLHVRDRGEGIPEDQYARVFDAFYQVADYLTRRVGGLGLGLAITKKIVEAHEGLISVDSSPERGTDIKIELPKGKGLLGR